jgi:putative ABC transport system permease protein
VSASEKWFRLLLHLYPPDFRDEMGAALVETYVRRSSETSPAALWLVALWDSLRNGLGERLSPAAAWRRAGDWGRDMEVVTRRFRQRPMLLAAVVATLTAGMGIFAVVYAAVDKVLVEPLPYEHPEDLHLIWRKTEKFSITGPEAAELRTAAGVIERAGILRWTTFTLSAGPHTDASRQLGVSVSPELFDVLGVRPKLGRGFRPNETGPGAPHVIVLSDLLWRRLGADAGILGNAVNISGQPFTVIGVMPPNFNFSASETETIDAYLPLYDDLPAQPPLVGDWMALVRARHGASPKAVQDAVDYVSRRVDERVNNGKSRGLRAIRLQEDLVAPVRPALVALSFTAIFLVLVLTVNLASILFARAAEREREFAVARALGATGPAIMRATLIEGGLLGFAGGVTGALAGTWGARLLVALGPADLPRRESIGVDWKIGAAVIVTGAVIGFLAAAAPAIWAWRVSLQSLLTATALRGSASSGRMRRGLIIAQVALSLVLLSAGGLVARSFQRLLAADPGFRPEGVLTFGVGLGAWLFPQEADSVDFQNRSAEALAALPGVRRVSATSTLPLTGGGSISLVYLPDRVPDGIAGYRVFVRAGYFETMGMRLFEGRAFQEARHEGVHEALIDRNMARHFFPDRSPVGAAILCDDRMLTIIGVVEQPRIESLHRDDAHPQIFMRAEDYSTRCCGNAEPWHVVVRTDRGPAALIPEVRAIVRGIDPRVPVSDVYTMDDIVAARRSHERISAILIGGLALGALLLVSMGLFGVISGSVARRRGELAVRIALGGTNGRVIRLVVGEGARLIAAGMVISLPGIYISATVLRGLLIEVSPFDASTLTGAGIGLAAVALLACYLAARRITAIEPSRLLREGG